MPKKPAAKPKRRTGVKDLGRRTKLSAAAQKKVKGGQLQANSQKIADSESLANKLRSKASAPGEW